MRSGVRTTRTRGQKTDAAVGRCRTQGRRSPRLGDGGVNRGSRPAQLLSLMGDAKVVCGAVSAWGYAVTPGKVDSVPWRSQNPDAPKGADPLDWGNLKVS